MDNGPFFSIVIPVYNKADFILDCIDSVLNQMFTDFELVVIDDGSEDDSIQLIKENYDDQRINIISQVNQGRCMARNTGIDHSIGNWICFLDADDLFLNNHLEVLFELIKNHSGFDMYCTKQKFGKRILPFGKRKYKRKYFKISFDDFLKSNPLTLNQCTFSRITIKKFPEERFPISEDWYYLRSALFNNKICGTNTITAVLRDHTKRTMNSTEVGDIVKWNIYGAQKIIGELRLQSTTKKQILGYITLLCSNLFLNDRSFKQQGLSYLKKSFRYFPYNFHPLLFKALIKIVLK